MTSIRTKPAQCQTMAEVRHGVDRLDEEIVARLGERFRYMEAAARIKPSRDRVRDEARKAQVIGNAKVRAAAEGVPADLVEALWELLVERSIAHELDTFDRTRGGSGEML